MDKAAINNRHILNVKEIEKRVVKNKSKNLYEKINMVFKGFPNLSSKKLIREVASILRKEHEKNMLLLEEMEDKCPTK